MNKKVLFTLFLITISCRAGIDGRVLKQTDYNFAISEFGGFEVSINNCRIAFEQIVSYPGDWSCFGFEKDEKTDRNLDIKVNKINEKKYSVIISSKLYQIVRTISLLDYKISISDRIENKSDGKFGCIIKNRAIPKTKTTSIWLSGNPIDVVKKIPCCAENPTVFFGFSDFGFGLILEDDVYRLQAEIAYERGVVELKTEQFGIGKTLSDFCCWWSLCRLLWGV